MKHVNIVSYSYKNQQDSCYLTGEIQSSWIRSQVACIPEMYGCEMDMEMSFHEARTINVLRYRMWQLTGLS